MKQYDCFRLQASDDLLAQSNRFRTVYRDNMQLPFTRIKHAMLLPGQPQNIVIMVGFQLIQQLLSPGHAGFR